MANSSETVNEINLSVTGQTAVAGSGAGPEADAGGGGGVTLPPNDPTLPFNQARGIVTQSIAQSTAIAISDASDMLRNIETVMTAAMGVAMANWLKQPGNLLYSQIIDAANNAIATAAANYKTIGTNASDVLNLFDPSSE